MSDESYERAFDHAISEAQAMSNDELVNLIEGAREHLEAQAVEVLMKRLEHGGDGDYHSESD